MHGGKTFNHMIACYFYPQSGHRKDGAQGMNQHWLVNEAGIYRTLASFVEETGRFVVNGAEG